MGCGCWYWIGEDFLRRGMASKCTVDAAFMLWLLGTSLDEGSQCVGEAGVEYDCWK
jgi:hypothetical protein